MKQLGYGDGYEYDHDAEEGFSGANYWPEGMHRRRFYQPTDRGAEAAVAERVAQWDALRARKARPR
jgi:putative ATPase